MDLTILERFMALQVLPAEGDIVTLKVVQLARQDLALTEEEIVSFGVVPAEGGGVKWNDGANDITVAIALGGAAVQVLRDALDKLNGEKKLTPQHITLFDKVHMTTDAKKEEKGNG